MLTYDLNDRSEDPLYIRLYKRMKRDIESGSIAAHEKLPSKRSLARNLGLGVITVESAYAQLIAEGYAYAQSRRGYFACEIATASLNADSERNEPGRIAGNAAQNSDRRLSDRCLNACSIQEITAYRNQDATTIAPVARYDLSSGTMPADTFPFNAWAKTLRDTLSLEAKTDLLSNDDPRGTWRLRSAVAMHLRATRGLDAHPDRIVIGAGAQVLYNLIIQLLGKPDCVALENPGYARLARIYESNLISVAPIELDRNGMRIEPLRSSKASVAHITPSHQFPTGIVMPASRRYELLGWATEKPGRYIIEDDYDCEFRLAGKPISTLQSIDRTERVIYTNTFAKTLGSAFRIAYMVLPEHLSRIYGERLGFYSCTVPVIDQLALARFIEQGEMERHINRTKTRCRSIRNALIDSLEQTPIASYLSFENIDSGLHFIMKATIPYAEIDPEKLENASKSPRKPPLPIEEANLEQAITDALLAKNLSMNTLSSHRFAPRFKQNGGESSYTAKQGMRKTGDSAECSFIVSYAALAESDAKAAAEVISDAIGSFIRR